MKVYCIPGLAADGRVFKNIHLPPHCQKVCLEWIGPQKGETLQHYAMRMGSAIDTTQPFALIGISLGGMIAAELAVSLNPVTTILISSIPTSKELPPYYHWAGVCKLDRIVPIKLLQQATLLRRKFTTETSAAKNMLSDMVRKSDPGFIRWAMHAIISWKKESTPIKNIVQVHGSKDFILPLKYTKPTHVIEGAGHLMVLTRAKDINKIVEEQLQKFPR